MTSMKQTSEQYIQYKLDFFNFVPVALGFLGWFLFVMFAGIGLVALPMDLILGFFFQPKYVRVCLTSANTYRASSEEGHS